MFDYGESRSGEYLLFYFKLLLNKNQVVGFLKSWKKSLKDLVYVKYKKNNVNQKIKCIFNDDNNFISKRK